METKPESNMENKVERIPTMEEVLVVIGESIEICKIGLDRSDEKGLYSLSVIVEGGKRGSKVEYVYSRKGVFLGPNQALETEIQVVFYDENDIPYYSENVASFDESSGEWKKV